MIIETVRCAAANLPDALKVGPPVWRAWDSSYVGCDPGNGRCGLRGGEMCRCRSDGHKGQQDPGGTRAKQKDQRGRSQHSLVVEIKAA